MKNILEDIEFLMEAAKGKPGGRTVKGKDGKTYWEPPNPQNSPQKGGPSKEQKRADAAESKLEKALRDAVDAYREMDKLSGGKHFEKEAKKIVRMAKEWGWRL